MYRREAVGALLGGLASPFVVDLETVARECAPARLAWRPFSSSAVRSARHPVAWRACAPRSPAAPRHRRAVAARPRLRQVAPGRPGPAEPIRRSDPPRERFGDGDGQHDEPHADGPFGDAEHTPPRASP